MKMSPTKVYCSSLQQRRTAGLGALSSGCGPTGHQQPAAPRGTDAYQITRLPTCPQGKSTPTPHPLKLFPRRTGEGGACPAGSAPLTRTSGFP